MWILAPAQAAIVAWATFAPIVQADIASGPLPINATGHQVGPCIPAAIHDWRVLSREHVDAVIEVGRLSTGELHAIVRLRNHDGSLGTAVGAGTWALAKGFTPISALDANNFWIYSDE